MEIIWLTKIMLDLNKIKTTWDLSALFDGDDDPLMKTREIEVRAAVAAFVDKWEVRQDYLSDPAILKEALDDYEAWRHQYGEDGGLAYYFQRRLSQEQDNPIVKAKYSQAMDLAVAMSNQMRFFILRLAKITPERQVEFLTNESLGIYRHLLEQLFKMAKYQLSEEAEKIISLKNLSAHDAWVDMVSDFLSREQREVVNDSGQKELLSFSKISSLLDSKNKTVRDDAARAFNDILAKHNSLAEAEMNAILKNKSGDDDLRGLSRSDMARHLSDDIATETVDLLISNVSDRFDIAQRYYQLKARLFGVEKLAYHEKNLVYGELNKAYNFNDAVNLVYGVLDDLDPEFSAIFKNFLEQGQVDVFPTKGKDSGAYCSHDLITQPTYVMLNHTDRLNDVLTLAHEFGHAINNELMRQKQNAVNFSTSTATAEVASTFMEDFVLARLMQEADPELKLALLMMKLNSFVSSVFRQVAAYQFEQELHAAQRQAGYLSCTDIGQIFSRHMAAYMGTAVEQSTGSDNWWVYWSHFRNFFYVYSYASGLLISSSLQKSYRENKEYLSKVKEFLQTGRALSPEESFARLGIDIKTPEFWQNALLEIERYLDEAEDLARQLGKI